MTENWLPVVGYEGYYEVSDLGRVRSVPRKRTRGHVLTPSPDRNGYPRFGTSVEAVRKMLYTHQAVAAAFLGPRPDGLEVRHLNGDKTDARLVNLAYGTRQENMLDINDYGQHYQKAKKHCPSGHEYTAENTYIEPGRPTSRACRRCRSDRTPLYTQRQTERRRGARTKKEASS